MSRTIATENEILSDLAARVGSGFLRNTVREKGLTCNTCTTPVEPEYVQCYRCNATARTAQRLDVPVADLVVPLAYAIKGSQSSHLMYNYKTSAATPAGTEQLKLLCAVGIGGHSSCIHSVAGTPITGWSTVPSTRMPGSNRHIRAVANPAINELTQRHRTLREYLLIDRPDIKELRLMPGPGFQRKPRELVPDMWRPAVGTNPAGHHVLLVEDTWITGGNAQSAAAALRTAGAKSVTILTLTRWLDPNRPLVRKFISNRLSPYGFDLSACPVAPTGCVLSLRPAPEQTTQE